MRLDLLRAGAVVDVADEDAAVVDVLFALAQVLGLRVQLRLHLAQSRGFGLHFLHALLHCFDLFFVVAVGGGLALGLFLLGFALIFGGAGLEGFGLALLGVGHDGWLWS